MVLAVGDRQGPADPRLWHGELRADLPQLLGSDKQQEDAGDDREQDGEEEEEHPR